MQCSYHYNHPPDEFTSAFVSTAWSYDHNGPCTCPIQTHIQSLHLTEYHDDTPDDDNTSTGSHSTLQDLELEYNPTHDFNFFGIPHTLTANISTAPTQSLRKAHTRLNTTRRAKLHLVTIQRLLSSLKHSMCSHNLLCTLIPYQHCLKFDKRTHNLYLSATPHTYGHNLPTLHFSTANTTASIFHPCSTNSSNVAHEN